ncbi:hypothetical protein CHARACLAT_031977 [Characodon lateralis]|uniref:Uncharacterized protein n=1 Tax=Characodon lateralis TaxID=208331 RepID=A0ABU7DLJ4_9TELE|nr:hypothetical protein [Characodon lateralis]
MSSTSKSLLVHLPFSASLHVPGLHPWICSASCYLVHNLGFWSWDFAFKYTLTKWEECSCVREVEMVAELCGDPLRWKQCDR